MKKRFIVLLDLNEHSAALLRYAFQWSLHANTPLVLLHQTSVIIPGLAHTEYKQSLINKGNEDALQLLKELVEQTLPTGTEVQYQVSGKHLLEQLELLQSEPFEHVIFAGAKSNGLIKRLFLGTKTIEIIEHLNTTLVVMPANFTAFTHRHLWVAVAEKHPINIENLSKLLSLFPEKEIKITFFSIVQKKEHLLPIQQTLQSLANLFTARYITSIAVYEGTQYASDLQLIIQQPSHDILVMQKGPRDLMDIFFRKLMVNEVVNDGRIPVIILPGNKVSNTYTKLEI